MYKIKDLNRLKKADLVDIAKSKGLDLSNKTTKAHILQVFAKSKLVNDDDNLPAISPATTTFDFTSHSLYYVALTPNNLPQLPVIKFDAIYHYICHDTGSFKSLDRAVKHNTAGDITQLKICLVSFIAMTMSAFKNFKFYCLFSLFLVRGNAILMS